MWKAKRRAIEPLLLRAECRPRVVLRLRGELERVSTTPRRLFVDKAAFIGRFSESASVVLK
jgi:hypothetical protein